MSILFRYGLLLYATAEDATTAPPTTAVPTTIGPTTLLPTTISPATEVPNPYCLTLTIPSGTVGSDLTNFPIMVRLSDLGGHFWANVRSDGGDIRVFRIDGTKVPQDLVRFDYQSIDGVLFFKDTILSGSDNEWRICYGEPSLIEIPDNDSYGRNAVWSDYESVLLFGESGGDDRTGKAMGEIYGDPDCFEVVDSSSVDVESHQGVCWDGTYYYTSDTNAIRKWDSSWNLIDSNLDLLGDSGIPGVTHCGDIDYHSGKIYVPMIQNDDVPPYDNQHIAVFDSSDLSFIESFDISAQAHEAGGICYCDRDDLLYIIDWSVGDKVYKYSPIDGTYQGFLQLDKQIHESQGITWWREYFWISGDLNDEVFRVSYTGEVSTGGVVPENSGGLFGQTVAGGNLEGIGKREEDILLLIDPGATERVDIYRPVDMSLGCGGGVRTLSSAYIKADGRSSFTTFTIGASVIFETTIANQTPLSYWEDGSANTRANFGYSTAFNNFNIWDSSGNGSLRPTPEVSASEDTPYRLHMQYSGTSFRKLFIDGVEKASQAGILSCPNSLDTLMIGIEDEDLVEPFTGLIGFVYLRDEILSADWIEAEYSNINDPSNFYEIDAILLTLDLSDSIILTDLFSYGWTFYLNLSDIITLTDVSSKLSGKSLSDIITLSDTIVKVFGKVIADSITLVDSFGVNQFLHLADIIHLNEKIYKGVSRPIADVILMTEEIEFSPLPLIPGPGLIFDWTNGYPRRAFPVIPFTYQYEKPHYNEAESISSKALAIWKTPDMFAHMRITPTHNPWCGYWYVGVSGSSGPKPDGAGGGLPWPWNPPTFPHTMPPAPLTAFPTTAPPVTCHCDEDLSYTSPYMFVGESQSILVIDPNPCCIYSWTLEGEGDLDTSNPLHVIYTAPDENIGCLFNPIIRLFCGLEMCAEIHINVTNPLSQLAGYGAYCAKSSFIHSYGGGFNCYECYASIQERHLFCDGTSGVTISGCSQTKLENVCTPLTCNDIWTDLCDESGSDCNPAPPSFCTDGCLPYGEFAAPAFHDTRTQAQKDLGCCPPQLM